MIPRHSVRAACIAGALFVGVTATEAQEVQEAQEGTEEPEVGWSNSTELSLVVVEGNSDTTTLGFKNRLHRQWRRSGLVLRLEGVRTDTVDDRFGLVDPDGIGPGIPAEDRDFVVVSSPREVDVERFLVEGRFDRQVSEAFFWNTGASLDRNRDAGIEGRSQLFAGVGHVWVDDEDLGFRTLYGLSYTDIALFSSDPQKDDSFFGGRFGWEYRNRLGSVTTFMNTWSANANVNDFGDYRFDMLSAIAVAMNDRLAIQISLQWLYENQPALDSIALIVDDTTGAEAIVGSADVRGEKLDTIFNTGLVISF